MAWSDKFIGIPYVECDCAQLAQRVQREQFGREIALPSEREGESFGLSAQIKRLHQDYGVPTTTPREGDAVIMLASGRLWHIGVYLEINGVPHVLHALKRAGGSCLHKVRDLSLFGLAVEGYYQWR